MAKWNLLILILFVSMTTALAELDDCQKEITPGEVPCLIVSPPYGTNCTTLTISFIEVNATLLDERVMDSYGFGRCNATFNYSNEGDYLFNISNGDSGRITVEANDSMIYFTIAIIYLFFTSLIVISIFYAQKIWLKTSLSFVLALMVATLLRFSSWFVSIAAPNQTQLINTLDKFYAFGVWGMRITMILAVFVVLIVILNSVKLAFKPPAKNDWDSWGLE